MNRMFYHRRSGLPERRPGEDLQAYRDRLMRPRGDAGRDAQARGWADHVLGQRTFGQEWQRLADSVNPRQCLLTPPGEPVPMMLSADGARCWYLLGLAGLDESGVTQDELEAAVYFLSATLPGRKIVQDLVPGYWPEEKISSANLDWLRKKGLWHEPREARKESAFPGEPPPVSQDVKCPDEPDEHRQAGAGMEEDADGGMEPWAGSEDPDEGIDAGARPEDAEGGMEPWAGSEDPDEGMQAGVGPEDIELFEGTQAGAEREVSLTPVPPAFLDEAAPVGLRRPCSVCEHLPGGWHKCCPACRLTTADGEEDVDRYFGFRTIRGKKTPQTWCRRCRSGQSPPPQQQGLPV